MNIIKFVIKKILLILSVLLPKSLIKKLAIIEITIRRYIIRMSFKKNSCLKVSKNKYKHDRVFILATGPSLNKINLAKLKNEYTIGVNSIYKIANDINLNYFIYVSDWYYKEHLSGFNSIKTAKCFFPKMLKNKLNKNPNFSFINVQRPIYKSIFNYEYNVPYKFSKNVSFEFEAGGTVIFLALQLAYHLGFKDIYILGLDHNYGFNSQQIKSNRHLQLRKENAEKYHFDKNYSPNSDNIHIDLKSMENAYHLSKKELNDAGINVFNSSPGSKLKIFKKKVLKNILL